MTIPHARIGLVGAGTIAARYARSLALNDGFVVSAVASRSGESAARLANDLGIAALDFEAMLADPSINYVLNLTPARQHGAVTAACLEAGKHVYSEKPIAATLAEADRLIGRAQAKSLLLAAAPASFLAPHTVRFGALLQGGAYGRPTSAAATLVYPGPDAFHPDPEHVFAAGPLRDVGVYPITTLAALLGPVVEVGAIAARLRPLRSIAAGPHRGRAFESPGPTQISAHLRHASGPISTVSVSWDGGASAAPGIEVHTEAGGLALCGELAGPRTLLARKAPEPWAPIALTAPPDEADWAIGPVSAWRAFHAGRPIPASGARARHALAVIEAVERACAEGLRVPVEAPAGSTTAALSDIVTYPYM